MTLATLQKDARWLVSPQLSSGHYEDVDLNRNMNNWYEMAISWVLEYMGGWEHNAEFATSNLVADQQEYVLPTTMLRLTRVEIKYPSSTEYVAAALLDDKNIPDALGNGVIDGTTTGGPAVRVADNSLFLYPAPDDGVTAGLRIEYVKDLTELSNSGDLPNLPKVIHRILSMGGAHDYALSKEMYSKKKALYREIYGFPGVKGTGLKYQLESWASRREHIVKRQIRVKRESFN